MTEEFQLKRDFHTKGLEKTSTLAHFKKFKNAQKWCWQVFLAVFSNWNHPC